MGNLFLLSVAKMRRIKPYLLLSHAVVSVNDRRVISGIILRYKEWAWLAVRASGYGPQKNHP